MSTQADDGKMMCTSSVHADHDLPKINRKNIQMQEQREKDFFSLFDFAAASASNGTDNIGSSIKTIQGAASAVFGGIWSALDTAIAILNEDMEASADHVLPADDEGKEEHGHDSVTDVKFEQVQGDVLEKKSAVFKPQSIDNVKSDGDAIVLCLRSKKVVTGKSYSCGLLCNYKCVHSLTFPLLLDSHINYDEGPNASIIESSEINKASSQCPDAPSSTSSTMVPDSFDNPKSIADTRGSMGHNDQHIESEYCIIPNQSHKSETDDGWLVVSEE